MELIKNEQYLHECEKLLYKLFNKSSVCMCPGCRNMAGNSHVLQNKKILKPIAPQNHLYCFEPNSLFKKEQRLTYKRRGIGEVLAFNGYCQYHDDQIFSSIEKSNVDVDWDDQKSQFLLGYRSICREIYVKQIMVEYNKALINKYVLPYEKVRYLQNCILGDSLGIKDMKRYKEFLELGIFSNNYSNYNFETIILPVSIELCVSSPISVSYSLNIPNKDIAEADFVETNIVNVFPYKGKSIVIIGFANEFDNRWAKEFSRKLKTQEVDLICKTLSDLILFRAEFHCMSEKLYQSISKEDLNEFLKKSEETVLYLSNSLSTHLNIFKHFTHN